MMEAHNPALRFTSSVGDVDRLAEIPDESINLMVALAPLRHMAWEQAKAFFGHSGRILARNGMLMYYLHTELARNLLPPHAKVQLAALIDDSLALFEPGNRILPSHLLYTEDFKPTTIFQKPFQVPGGIFVVGRKIASSAAMEREVGTDLSPRFR